MLLVAAVAKSREINSMGAVHRRGEAGRSRLQKQSSNLQRNVNESELWR